MRAQPSVTNVGQHEPLSLFTTHLGYWLRIYSACVFVQTASVFVVQSVDCKCTSYGAEWYRERRDSNVLSVAPSLTVLARILLGLPKVLMSIAKVNGLTKAKKRRPEDCSTRKPTSLNGGPKTDKVELSHKGGSKIVPSGQPSQLQGSSSKT